MNIEFGCGEKPTKEGFKTCDIRNVPGVDFVCPAWDIDKFIKPNTVNVIFSRHFFEHLTFRQGELVLQKWYNILVPGGTMEMMLPNMTYHIEQWVSRSNMRHAKAGFWGWQRGDFNDVWDTHKSGYDFELLKDTLVNNKYVRIEEIKKFGDAHLHIKCNKPK